MKFSIEDFFSKRDKTHRKLWILPYLLKKSLKENFIFCPVIKKQSFAIITCRKTVIVI